MSSQHAEMQPCPNCGDHVPSEYVICVWCGFDLTAEKIRQAGINIGNREAIERMQRVVRDPMNAFQEISLLPDLRGGKMIFYVLGIVMTFNMLTLISKLDGLAINTDNQPGVRLFTTSDFVIPYKFFYNILFLIIQPLVLFVIFNIVWKFSARVLALLSKSFGGRGDREKIRAVIGYSMLPVIFGWAMAWLIRLITPSQSVESTEYSSVSSALVSISEQGFGIVGMIFIYLGWFWALGLGVIGLKHAGRLSWVEAVVVAGIPYALFMTIVL